MNIESAIQSLISHWIEQHPTIFWLLQHPLITLVSSLVIIILFARLLVAIAYFIDRVWIWIIKSPWLLLKSLLGLKSKNAEVIGNTVNYEIAMNPEQLGKIVQQLERIEQQQEQILQDIAILKQKNKTINIDKSVIDSDSKVLKESLIEHKLL